jgi:Tfp pilus assembly pilus retraction ATPase PilT
MGAQFGMKSLDKDLAGLVRKGTVTFEAALGKANNIKLFKSIAQGARH